MLSLFLRFELGKVGKYFKTKTTAKAITTLLFLVVFSLLGIGIYNFFFSGFRYIYFGIEEEFRQPLLLFIYEIFSLILAGVIVASAMVSGVFTLFRGEYNTWLLSSPGYKVFPKFVLIKSLLISMWPLFVIFLPVILAFNKVYSLGIGSLVVLGFSIALLLLLLNALTLSVTVILGSLYYMLSQKVKQIRFYFNGFIGLLFVVIVANLAVVWKIIADIDLVKIFKAEDADALVTVANIGSYFEMFPTHPLALQIISLQNGEFASALMYMLFLALIAGVLVFVWWRVSPLFYPLWQVFQEGSERGSREQKGEKVSNKKTYHFTGGPIMALFKKEALVSSRNWKGVLWFLFLSFIWLVQIGASFILEHNIRRHEPDISQQMAILQTLQFVIAVYFISSFTLRFVFSSFSVEKKTAWILGSAPLKFAKIFFGKYLFYTSFFVALGVLMNYVNIAVLNVALGQALHLTVLLVATIIFIVTLGLTMGALFPNKESDDPEVISTSMSGLFFTALALLYGAGGAWTLHTAVAKGILFPLELFVGVSVVLVGITLFFIPKLLKQSAV